jgi:hypothetical protein
MLKPQPSIYIRTKTGLEVLQRAAIIVQEAIFQAFSGVQKWKKYFDGPHSICLGRAELHGWIGEYSPDAAMTYNGHSAQDVWRAVREIVDLRNTIAHVEGRRLRDAKYVDNRLYFSQRITIILGDEKGAKEIRAMQDTVRVAANGSLQFIRDAYFQVIQPFYELPEFETHHQKMFEEVLDTVHSYGFYESYREVDYKEIFTVAQAWSDHRPRAEDDEYW